MSLDDANVIDAAGIESSTDRAVLSIIDSWDWDDEEAHLLALQSKLNTYFDCIDSGEVREAYPPSKGRQLVIDVITRFPLPPSGRRLLEKASEVACELDVVIRHEYYPGRDPAASGGEAEPSA